MQHGKTFCMVRAVIVAAVLAVMLPLGISWASSGTVPTQTNDGKCVGRQSTGYDCGWEGDEAFLAIRKGTTRSGLKLYKVSDPAFRVSHVSDTGFWVSVQDDNVVQRTREATVSLRSGSIGYNFKVRFHDDDVARLTAHNTQWRRWDFRLTRPVEGERVDARLLLRQGANNFGGELTAPKWEAGESGTLSENYGAKNWKVFGTSGDLWYYFCIDGPEATLGAWAYDGNGNWNQPFGPRPGSGLPMVIVEPAGIDICQP